ncbi:MAG: PPOX class F420-dependent oxidoreductase [Chloroflexi bacterium]|nr:PPOX class F420-dependent oxidoreductase [Chloroflexota bacterium]
MAMLNEKAIELLKGVNFASLATVMADGTPQVSAVWVDTDGTDVLINTAEGRVKTKNMARNPNVAVSVFNQQNPYEEVTIRGKVTEMTHEGADAHIDAMAKKYLGQDTYPFRQAGEERVLVRISPEKVGGMG